MRKHGICPASLICILLWAAPLWSQQADAVIDRSEIRMGEQAVIKLSVAYGKESMPNVVWPQIGDTLVRLVEVISKTTIDSLKTGREVQEARLEQRITITCFDSGYYAIPPFRFEIDGRPVLTEAFLFTVRGVEIDTTKGIHDIVEIIEVDLSLTDYLKEYLPYIVGFGAAALLLGLAVIYFLHLREKRRPKAEAQSLQPAVLPHTRALEVLEQLRRDRHYAVGKVKKHYTILTDALRDYLEAVYQIPAHEYTTAQIISKMRYAGLEQSWLVTLREILGTADMVKFAKERPEAEENEAAVSRAIEFVRATHLAHAASAEADSQTQDTA